MYLEEKELRNGTQLLLNYNPVHKKVPILIHGDKPIAEFLLILEYIDEMWKERNPSMLLPEDPYERAMARFSAKFADDKCLFGAWKACHTEGEEKRRAIESVRESLAFLEKLIEGKKFFGGEQIGYLDLALGGCISHCWLNVLEQLGDMILFEAERFPLLNKWAQNFIQIPVIKDCLPPREILVNYITGNLNCMRSLAPKKQ